MARFGREHRPVVRGPGVEGAHHRPANPDGDPGEVGNSIPIEVRRPPGARGPGIEQQRAATDVAQHAAHVDAGVSSRHRLVPEHLVVAATRGGRIAAGGAVDRERPRPAVPPFGPDRGSDRRERPFEAAVFLHVAGQEGLRHLEPGFGLGRRPRLPGLVPRHRTVGSHRHQHDGPDTGKGQHQQERQDERHPPLP